MQDVQTLVASRDLVGEHEIHRKFQCIKHGTVVLAKRVGRDTHRVAFRQDDKDFVFEAVPLLPFTKLINRLWPYPKRVNAQLVKLMKGVPSFDPVKTGTLVKYQRQGTFPDVTGIVQDDTGKLRRDCIIAGAPEPGTTGRLVLMLDQSVVFYPEL